LNAQDGAKTAALHYAVLNNNQSITKLLCAADANLNIVDKDKKAAIDYATHSQQVNSMLVKILVAYGAHLECHPQGAKVEYSQVLKVLKRKK